MTQDETSTHHASSLDKEALLESDERVVLLHEAQQGAKVMLLHDADVRRALLGFKGRAFHYVMNRRGANFMWVVSALALIASAATLAATGAPTLLLRVVVVACGALSVALGSFVWRWRKAAQTGFIALDEEHLYVGDNKRAWRIAWELLDAQSMGFHEFDASSGQGVLKLRVAGQEIPMQLYHPLMHIEDLQGLMVELLSRLPQDESAEEPAESEGSAGDL